MPSPPSSPRSRVIPIVLAQAVGLACGVAGVKVASHLVPPAALGSYGIFVTFAPLGMWVVHAGLIKFVGRHWGGSGRRAGLLRETVAAWARRLPWLALAAGAATLARGGMTAAAGLGMGLALFAAAALLSLGALAQTALQAEGAHWRDSAVSASGSLLRTFAPPLLFVLTGGATAALWAGFCGHAFVLAAAGAWALRSYWRRVPGAADGRREITPVYDGPLFIALAFSSWALNGLNRWVVLGFFGETNAGFYTLASGAAVLVPSMLGTVFMQYFQPSFFALGDGPAPARSALARRIDAVALAHGVLSLAGVGVLALGAPWLIGPLISPKYNAALGWLLPAGCFGTAIFTGIFYHSMLLAGRRERACGPTDLITAGVLAGGCLASAAAGQLWFARWLVATPLVPWLLTRPLARWYFARPNAASSPAPAP